MNGLLQVQCIDNPCVARAVCIKEKYIFFHLTHTLPLLQAGEEIDSAMKISRPSLCLSYCFCCSLYRIKSPQIIQFKHQIFVFSQDNKGKKAEETGMRFALCTLFSRGEALALMGAVEMLSASHTLQRHQRDHGWLGCLKWLLPFAVAPGAGREVPFLRYAAQNLFNCS